MKIRIVALVLLVCLLGVSIVGCSLVNPPAATVPSVTPQATINQQFTDFMTNQATQNNKTQKLITDQAALIDQMQKDITDLKSKVGNQVVQQTPAQIIANMTAADITSLKTSLGITSNPGTSGYNTPTGQVTYTLMNPLPYYQFATSSSNPIQVRVFNNKPDARYVRLQLTFSTFGSSATGGFGTTPIEINVMSNSTGQAVAHYLVNAVGNTILLVANVDGINGQGEYLLSSGQQMDVYYTFIIHSTNAVLWTLTVAGSDRPIS